MDKRPLNFNLRQRRWWILSGAGALLLLGGIYYFTTHRVVEHPQDPKRALLEIRRALASYFGENNGYYPERLEKLNPKYLKTLPLAAPGEFHSPSRQVKYMKHFRPDDRGGWLYVTDPNSGLMGRISINCTHKDPQGRSWSAN